MKTLIKYFTIIAALAVLSGVQAIAQKSSSAVMTITAEVVSGSVIERNDRINTFTPNGEEITYGEFSMVLAEGSEVIATSTDKVQINSGVELSELNSAMTVETSEDGKINLKFTTKDNKELRKGFYTGIQIATIEYL